jgi:lipoyl(octanoyl) transferase
MEARLSLEQNPAADAAHQVRLCQVYQLGRVPYREAWELQRKWVELRRAGEIPDRLLVLEHPPVITLGRNACREHLLSPPELLASEGIDVVETNRGGDVTFHGPGQLVGYPILDLSAIRKDVVWYVRTLEEAIIRALDPLGLAACRRAGMTGVWVEDRKVAAIGIHISRWITSHGFALNVDTDLGYFRHIVPCGIASHPVTSLRELLGEPVDRASLADRLCCQLGDLLGLEMSWSAFESESRLPFSDRRKQCLPPMC